MLRLSAETYYIIFSYILTVTFKLSLRDFVNG